MERGDVTEVLLRATAGAPDAVEELYPLVYDELRAIAEAQMRGERPSHTLQATELVHEAYLRLVDVTRCEAKSRGQFFALAGRAMRRILVDHARRRGAQKRGGGWKQIPLDSVLTLGTPESDGMMVALGDALEKLDAEQPEKSHVVEMLFFAGLTQDECAESLGISRRTVARYWEYAQAWLYREMAAGEGAG